VNTPPQAKNTDACTEGATESSALPAVRRRCMFYVSGFDPKGASHYHALYRDQAQQHAAATGVRLQVSPRRKLPGGNAFWTLDSGQGDEAVQTLVEFMRWDDVVRNNWKKDTLSLWWQVLSATVFNLRHGSLWAMYKLSWPPAVALAAPFGLLCVLLLGVPLLALGVGWWVAKLFGQVEWGLAAGLACGGALAWWGRKLEARFSMYWMVRSYHFTSRQATGHTPDLEQRLNEQAARLAERLANADDDEVLVVGHSSGAIMAAIVVARALALRPGLLAGGQRVSLLTLGQWLPLLGLLPMATAFRTELAALAAEPGLDWLDFSAPPDGCCFALCDPLQACGISGERRLRLKMLNPRFADMFDADAYAALKRDRFELHFQYLKTSPRPVDYSYFDITAGPLRLWDRFAHLPGVEGYSGLKPFLVKVRND